MASKRVARLLGKETCLGEWPLAHIAPQVLHHVVQIRANLASARKGVGEIPRVNHVAVDIMSDREASPVDRRESESGLVHSQR